VGCATVFDGMLACVEGFEASEDGSKDGSKLGSVVKFKLSGDFEEEYV